MKTFGKLLFAALIVLSINACEYETIVPKVIQVSNVSFSNDVQPIFTSSCIACHAGINPILKEGEAYNNLINGGYIDTSDPEASLLYIEITGAMSSYIKDSERQLILQWITEGAKDN